VKLHARVNEVVDDKTIIQRQRREIKELREELKEMRMKLGIDTG
jgi:hypothetical protein